MKYDRKERLIQRAGMLIDYRSELLYEIADLENGSYNLSNDFFEHCQNNRIRSYLFNRSLQKSFMEYEEIAKANKNDETLWLFLTTLDTTIKENIENTGRLITKV